MSMRTSVATDSVAAVQCTTIKKKIRQMKVGQSEKYDIKKISDLFAAFGEPIQNHVDEDISSGATDSVAAVHNYVSKRKYHI